MAWRKLHNFLPFFIVSRLWWLDSIDNFERSKGKASWDLNRLVKQRALTWSDHTSVGLVGPTRSHNRNVLFFPLSARRDGFVASLLASCDSLVNQPKTNHGLSCHFSVWGIRWEKKKKRVLQLVKKSIGLLRTDCFFIYWKNDNSLQT